MNAIDVSIVLITWAPNDKRLATLKKSFISIRQDTKRPYTLVVVDNGPKEQTDWLRQQNIDIHIINRVNQGVGRARNIGAAVTGTEFIAFADNDVVYFPNWLNKCVKALQKYSDKKLISTPRKSSPMRYEKHHIGSLDGYELYNRASGQSLVMRRTAWKEIGWSEANVPGGIFCKRARASGYRFIRNETWKARHICKRPSYNFRHRLVNGVWQKPVATGEQNEQT